MSTRFSKSKTDGQSISMGYEGSNVPDDFSIPSCTLEDVDRALFDLFNDQIPFYYQLENESRKIPVIFATGERFAILRRRRPLRDKAGVLILPLISMIRTGIEQDQTKGAGPGQGTPLVIKKRLSVKDPLYQRLINKTALVNQDDIASQKHRVKNSEGALAITGSLAGTVATRQEPARPSMQVRRGMLLANEVDSRNVYEFITVPPVKFFTATYEISFWSQYTQQMNDMLLAMMSAYQDMRKRTFRLETKKGYWFVAYVQPSMSSNSNFDDFSDQERIVKYSFSIEIPAYVINPSYPGAPNALRSFISAPEISFDVLEASNNMNIVNAEGPPSADLSRYVLQDFNTDDDDLPGTALIGQNSKAASISTNIRDGCDALKDDSVVIGGATAGSLLITAPFLGTNPFTGKTYDVPLPPLASSVKGETIYKDLSTEKANPEFNKLTEIDL